MPVRTRLTVALALTALAAGVTACSPDSGSSGASASSGSSSSAGAGTSSAGSASSATTSAAAASCTPASMKTHAKGVFTFGSDQPVYEPWYVKTTPTNGQGFESAVAYAVAAKLGYSKSQVKWTRVTFNAVIAPGPKKFDADLDEFSITDVRKKSIDFSSGYYDVTQAVIALNGSKAAAAHIDRRAARRSSSARRSARPATTAITDVIKPSQKPSVFNSNDDAKAALNNGQIGALVVDLPTAFYITSAQLNNAVIVGQLPVHRQARAVRDGAGQGTAAHRVRHPSRRRAAPDGTLTKLADTVAVAAGRAETLVTVMPP